VAKPRRHREKHTSRDVGNWLRAAVLGSNDAIVSTASLMLGVAASDASQRGVLIAGVAGMVGGAMSMAAGEYVSVSSLRDSEQADIAIEEHELASAPDAELKELAGIYVGRGLTPELAMAVAEQLSAHDRLSAHLRDELGIERDRRANPLQAAWVSAASFITFALLPIAALELAPESWRVPAIASASLVGLFSLGALGGHLGGAAPWRAAVRVTIGGLVAMGITAGIGRLFGVVAS